MSAASTPADVQLSRWVRVGAGWLALAGLGILAIVAFAFVDTRSQCGKDGYRFACDIGSVFGIVGGLVAALHLASAIGIWKRRAGAVTLGAFIAGLAAFGGLLTMENADEPWLWLIPTAAYAATVVILVVWLIAWFRRLAW